jgi:hypothetical protein
MLPWHALCEGRRVPNGNCCRALPVLPLRSARAAGLRYVVDRGPGLCELLHLRILRLVGG